MSKAIDDVLAERRRQIEVEGWTPEHDADHHTDFSLARVAATYAFFASLSDMERAEHRFNHIASQISIIGWLWPKTWHWKWWKPKNRRRDLIRAAALIIAEIERLDRRNS